MTDVDQLVAELRRLRDELSLKIHLGSKEAQDRWADLEKTWERFVAEADLQRSARGVGAAARALGQELKDGFEGIRKALR